MGVYIDMEMPQKTYAHCMLIKDIDGSAQLLVCTKNSGEISEWESYDLVPVPPHGRLIDADALLERFEKEEKAADEHGRDFSFSFKSGGENCTEWWPVQQMLMDAPTVLEAEEGET